MEVSGWFTPLNSPESTFNIDQYKALCAFFRQLTLSERLPLRKRVTLREVGIAIFCAI